tara:strand:+ start:91 stop:429 length:339 start_codon:yes stop_codon:yes gene_type:complete
MADYGIKVAEAGYDIATATDAQLILKSDFTLLKVSASGTTNISSGATATIAHGFSYIPQFLCFLKDPSDSKVYLCTAYHEKGPARADTTNVYIINNYGSTATAYYYIFYEQT